MKIPGGYELIEEKTLPDVDSVGYLLRHKKTKARVFVMESPDENKVFGIGFRTTPKDNTGTPHIIEHTVLCGSEKYPAKDPFVELAKGSLNTFLNAMTYPDKTIYPVASCNDKDFKNLMSVYMDAVFKPNIYKNRMLFEQEGWHFELEDEEAPLKINGVVYNEMKGAYSSAEDVLAEYVKSALFPDTEYRYDSGGVPENIPDLTYEAFLDFHRKLYHPSNSYIFLYGNADMTERLEWIDKEYLSLYNELSIDSRPAYQYPFTKPVCLKKTYGIAEDEDKEENTYFAWAKVVGDQLDTESRIAYNVLDQILLEVPGAPLKQALIDAGLGNEVYGIFTEDQLQPTFTVIVKGCDESKKEEVQRVINETLKKIADEGIERKSIYAILNAMEFSQREGDFGRTPKGLVYFTDVMASWLYDDMAVFDNFDLINHFKSLREKAEIGYFEQMIRFMLIDNPHGAFITLVPEYGYQEKAEELLAGRLAAVKASLGVDEIKKIAEHTKELKKFQETPSPEEDLEKIPLLSVEDVDRNKEDRSNIEEELDGIKVVRHDYNAAGIIYLTVGFDIKGFELADYPYLNFISSLLGNIDTKNYSYKELGEQLRLDTGSFNSAVADYRSEDSEDIRSFFEISTKCFVEKTDEMISLFDEVAFDSLFTDAKRIRELAAESRSGMASMFADRGHTFAGLRCLSYFSKTGCLAELRSGVSYYEFLGDLIEGLDKEPEKVCAKLREIYEKIADRDGMYISITCNKDLYNTFAAKSKALLERIPVSGREKKNWEIVPVAKNEGFKTSAQISFVCRAGDYKAAGDDIEYTGALEVLRIWMSYEYLWVNVRVLGGAYGCFGSFGRNGLVRFVSYRDPNVEKTVEVFDNAAAAVENLEISDRDLTKYILGAINERDVPMSSSAKGSDAMAAYLTGRTDEARQKEREQILDVTKEELKECAKVIAAAMKAGYVCAFGNASKIEEDKAVFDTVRTVR